MSFYQQIANPPSTTAITPIILAENDPATIPTTAVVLPSTQPYNLYVYGNFGGATVEVEWAIDGITFSPFQINGTDIQFSEQAFQYFFKLDQGMSIRLSFSVPGVGAALNAELR